jgi:hypothetical protein
VIAVAAADSTLLLTVVVAVGIASALVLFRVHQYVQSRQRWIGSPMAFAVRLIGRLMDGTVDDGIEGVPIQVDLHMRGLLDFLRQVLFDEYERMPPEQRLESKNLGKSSNPTSLNPGSNPVVMLETSDLLRKKKLEFARKIIPVFQEPVKLIPYAFGSNTLVVQFGHTDGPLNQYAFGPRNLPFRSVAQGGSMPLLIVPGHLYPYPGKISIPGGLRDAVQGKIPFLGKKASADVELFFFDPCKMEKVSTTPLSETVKSHLALLIETTAKFANIEGLWHEIQRLHGTIRGFQRRASIDEDTIKSLGREISRLRQVAGRGAAYIATDFLLPMMMSFLLWLVIGMVSMGFTAFLFGLHKDAGILAFLIAMGAMGGGFLGSLLNYRRYTKK